MKLPRNQAQCCGRDGSSEAAAERVGLDDTQACVDSLETEPHQFQTKSTSRSPGARADRHLRVDLGFFEVEQASALSVWMRRFTEVCQASVSSSHVRSSVPSHPVQPAAWRRQGASCTWAGSCWGRELLGQVRTFWPCPRPRRRGRSVCPWPLLLVAGLARRFSLTSWSVSSAWPAGPSRFSRE